MKLILAITIGALALIWVWYLLRLAVPKLFWRLEANPVQSEALWQQVQERLEAMAAVFRLPVPELRVLPEFSPNAMLLRVGRRAHIVLSEGLVRTLSGEELDSVLALSLTHVYCRGRTLHTLMALALFPFAQILQSFPFPLQLLVSPPLSFLLRFSTRPQRVVNADCLAATKSNPFRIAATLQKLSVLERKIPLERWNLAVDSLFLISPLSLESQPFFLSLLQPSIEFRRSRLLAAEACES